MPAKHGAQAQELAARLQTLRRQSAATEAPRDVPVLQIHDAETTAVVVDVEVTEPQAAKDEEEEQQQQKKASDMDEAATQEEGKKEEKVKEVVVEQGEEEKEKEEEKEDEKEEEVVVEQEEEEEKEKEEESVKQLPPARSDKEHTESGDDKGETKGAPESQAGDDVEHVEGFDGLQEDADA